MKHYIKQLIFSVLVILLVGGFHFFNSNHQGGYSAIQITEANGTTYTTYYSPTYNKLDVGWDGSTAYDEYYVADCWCIDMGHDN